MAEDYKIRCENCGIDVTVSVGTHRLATGANVCYCTKCKRIHNIFRCCGTETQIIGPPKVFLDSTTPEQVEVTTNCPKCGNKSLKWKFVKKYEV